MSDVEHWDLGDATFIRMSDKSLARVLRAIITLKGAVLDSYISEGYYKNKNLNTVCFRIRLPKGKKEEFEELSGFSLTSPPRVSL